jgi:choline dehydrogenase-like flavoprotein
MRGRVVEPFTQRETHGVEIRAKVVVLAAGCMATPILLLRSGVSNAHGWIGKDLQLHPGLAIMAVFPDRIDPWIGATQGYHSLEFLKEGIKLEVLWSPPSVLATRLPGVGHEFQHHLLNYGHMAPFDVIIAAEHSRGTVSPKRTGWNPDITFDFAREDVALIQRGLGILSDICWAAGADSILPGIHGLPEQIRSKAEAERLRTQRMDAKHMITASNHAFSTTRMSRRPEDGVVDEHGRCHGLDNVYVADTGIFPGSPAVNPMLTCMAMADKIAHGLIDRL